MWRVDLGPGYPGPIVSGDRVFTAETRDARTEVVRCLELATGKEVWKAEWPGVMSVPFFAIRNGNWIRATPACDGERLFVAGMRDVLVCLDAATGAEKWRVDFVAKYKTPLPAFGFVSSPLPDGDHVYVQAGGAVCKLDSRTGVVVWRVLENNDGMMGSAFSSPVIATICGTRQLVVQTRTTLAGVDPATGGVLWKQDVPAFRGMNILTPTVIGDAVFTSTYQNRSFLFRVSVRDGVWSVEKSWDCKVAGYMSTPVVVGGRIYVQLQNRRYACIDPENGKELWISNDRFGEYSSLVARGDRILALDQAGELLLIKADPSKFTLSARRKIADQESWGHLAVQGGMLLVRELKGLSAWRFPADTGDGK